MSEFRVVVAIDFGTTYSGFAYAHKKNPKEISAHDEWQDYSGRFKTPTVLKYDESLNCTSWGFPALAERPTKKKKSSGIKPIERFKLHLGKMVDKPYIPDGLDYKTAITDYLREMGKVIKETIEIRWQIDRNTDFFRQVFIVMTIPAEFDNQAIQIMRECACEAEIIKEKSSKNLKFTTEPEAAAIHCMKKLREYNVNVGSSFVIVDCGGGTVDLTTRKLLENEKLDETTEREGDYCGGSFVDEEFLKFIGKKVGKSALNMVRENHYGQLQYMVQEFCRRVKIQFTGQEGSKFQSPELDLNELCPVLKQYVKGKELDDMEDIEWIVELTFDEIKAMFDPVIGRIIRLIRKQLSKSRNVSAMLLVGGFSESKYLQARIKKEFNDELRKNIYVPQHPITAIVKGAVQFGLKQEIVNTRVLKWTYGTDVARKWRKGDPVHRKGPGGRIVTFSRLAKRGDQVAVNEKVVRNFAPSHMLQSKMGLDIYVTEKNDAKYCDESGVDLLDNWTVDLPMNLEEDRYVSFTLTFGSVEIEAVAQNDEMFETKNFDLDI